MKKLILGLFLIAGSSSYALAGTVEIKTNLDQSESSKKAFTQNETAKGEFNVSAFSEIYTQFFKGCYTQTITQYENSSGEYIYSVAGPRVSAPCGSGQIDGSTTTTYTHQVDPYWDLWPH